MTRVVRRGEEIDYDATMEAYKKSFKEIEEKMEKDIESIELFDDMHELLEDSAELTFYHEDFFKTRDKRKIKALFKMEREVTELYTKFRNKLRDHILKKKGMGGK